MAPRSLAFAAVLVALAATATAAYRPEPPSWMADNEFPYASMWSQATGKVRAGGGPEHPLPQIS
jgi:hypothetical protein